MNAASVERRGPEQRRKVKISIGSLGIGVPESHHVCAALATRPLSPVQSFPSSERVRAVSAF